MKLRLAAIGSALLLAFAAGPGPASAGTLTWDFFTLGGSPAPPGMSLGGITYTFTQGSASLFTESMTSTGCSGGAAWCQSTNDLYIKNGGTPGEQGLGLLHDFYGEHEITAPFGILLNLSGLGHATSVDMGSVQSGETWAVWGWGGGTWHELGSGVGSGATVDFMSSKLDNYEQLIVTDPFKSNQTGGTDSNNIVLESITTSTVPEPGALALFAAGLLGCALFVSRRRRGRQH
jgi:hypothetical protein